MFLFSSLFFLFLFLGPKLSSISECFADQIGQRSCCHPGRAQVLRSEEGFIVSAVALCTKL